MSPRRQKVGAKHNIKIRQAVRSTASWKHFSYTVYFYLPGHCQLIRNKVN